MGSPQNYHGTVSHFMLTSNHGAGRYDRKPWKQLWVFSYLPI